MTLIIAIGGLFLVLYFLGIVPYVVLSGSMDDTFRIGDLIIIKEIKSEFLEVGDIISFRTKDNYITTHRIHEISKNSDNEIVFITKGDNNNRIDKDIVSSNMVEGKYVFRIAALGNFILFIQKPLGFILFMGLIIVICISVLFSKNNDLGVTSK